MAGGSIATRVSVEGVTDPTGIAGAESTSNVAIGRDVACWDLLDKRVDLIKKGHSESLSLIWLTTLASVPFLGLVWVPII